MCRVTIFLCYLFVISTTSCDVNPKNHLISQTDIASMMGEEEEIIPIDCGCEGCCTCSVLLYKLRKCIHDYIVKARIAAAIALSEGDLLSKHKEALQALKEQALQLLAQIPVCMHSRHYATGLIMCYAEMRFQNSQANISGMEGRVHMCKGYVRDLITCLHIAHPSSRNMAIPLDSDRVCMSMVHPSIEPFVVKELVWSDKLLSEMTFRDRVALLLNIQSLTSGDGVKTVIVNGVAVVPDSPRAPSDFVMTPVLKKILGELECGLEEKDRCSLSKNGDSEPSVGASSEYLALKKEMLAKARSLECGEAASKNSLPALYERRAKLKEQYEHMENIAPNEVFLVMNPVESFRNSLKSLEKQIAELEEKIYGKKKP